MIKNEHPTEPLLYFLHIPKTAGTTFTNIFDKQFPTNQICPAHLWSNLLRIRSTELAAYHYFRGHFYTYFESFIKRPLQPLQSITFLRDPLERSLSHYFHVYNDPHHYFYQRAHEQGDLLTFLHDPATNPLIANYQTRSLAIDLDPIEIAKSLSPEELASLKLEQILETTLHHNMSDQELLDRAKSQIDRCLFVGLTERFDESVSHIAKLLHWNLTSSNIFLNVSQSRPKQMDISPKERALILEQTYLDYELYAYVQARLDRYSFP